MQYTHIQCNAICAADVVKINRHVDPFFFVHLPIVGVKRCAWNNYTMAMSAHE